MSHFLETEKKIITESFCSLVYIVHIYVIVTVDCWCRKTEAEHPNHGFYVALERA